MSTLLLLLPPRSRLRASAHDTPPGDAPVRGEYGLEYDYLFSSDGQSINTQSRRPSRMLPRADNVVLVPAEGDISWHRITMPRAKTGKLRAALAGMLEEQLLEDPDQLHFAVDPDVLGGEPGWVAVISKPWLQDHLAELEQAHLVVDRIAPLSWPGLPPQGHLYDPEPDAGFAKQAPSLALQLSHPDGVGNLRVEGSLSRSMLNPELMQAIQWSATPDVAAPAERWLGSKITVVTPQQRALQALQSPWNLRQFDLALRTGGVRAVRQIYRNFMRRTWRPVRLGLAALLGVQLLGMNLSAWQLRQQLDERKAELGRVLKSSFPQVRAVLDAPVQMRREMEQLRAQSGRPSEQDFETLMAVAAQAWPGDRGPADGLAFEPGRLHITASGWSDAQIQTFRQQLQSEGWALDFSDGRMSISRQRPGGASR